MRSLLPVWSYAASPKAFPGKCCCWKMQGSGRMKPFFRSVLVLIPTAAPRACSGPGKAPKQGRTRLGAVFQPAFMPHRRGMESSSSSAEREMKDRRGMAGLDKMCTFKIGMQKYESCILSIFIGWCSVLLYRAQKWAADGQTLLSCQVTPLNGTGLGIHLLRKQTNAGGDCPVNST